MALKDKLAVKLESVGGGKRRAVAPPADSVKGAGKRARTEQEDVDQKQKKADAEKQEQAKKQKEEEAKKKAEKAQKDGNTTAAVKAETRASATAR